MSKDILEAASALLCATLVLLLSSGTASAETQIWTLESSAKQLLKESPTLRAAEAQVQARRGELQQSGAWPNPTIELGASNIMGKNDGQGGTDQDRFRISQPLPLSGRLGLQGKQADANLKQSQAEAAEQRLALEYETAQTFHNLQLRRAELALAEQKLKGADELQNIGLRREQAGDLSRMERLRLDVVRESARQLTFSAEGEYDEARASFQTLLNIHEPDPNLTELALLPLLPALPDLETRMEQHPMLMAARQSIEAAQQAVELTRANRLVDPEVWIAQERDVLGGSRQSATAFGVAITVPLWDRSNGRLTTAQATKQSAQFKMEALQRELRNQLQLTHRHLGHLIEQTHEYQTSVLKPAEEIFQLTRKGFVAGQVEILNLVDAVDTYFDARARYLELLQESWLEAAALRRAVGLSLIATQPATTNSPLL